MSQSHTSFGSSTDLVHEIWSDLIRDTLKPVMAVTFVAYWAWQLIFVLSSTSFTYEWVLYVTMLSLLIFFICIAFIRHKSRLSVLIWSFGFSLCGIVIALFSESPLALILIPLASLMSSLLLNSTSSIILTIISLISFYLLNISSQIVDSSGFGALTAQAIITVSLGSALRRGLQSLVDWSLTSYRQTVENMREARQRRAEMVKLVKELDMAYARLARVNASLIQSWQQATKAERRRAELVTMISHELRAPLNLVLGFSEMIMTSPESYGGVPLPSIYRSDLNAIYRSSLHLMELVNDVIDLERADVGKLMLLRKPTDIALVLAEAANMVKEYIEAKGLELRIAIPSDLPMITIDPLRIRQVLLNLLTNAARFTESGWIEVGTRADEQDVTIWVSDTGRGMSAEETQRAFEPFRTTDERDDRWHGGAGLGLSISRTIVELHSGRISVQSVPMRGTTFEFSLPLSPGEQMQQALVSDPLPRHLSGDPLIILVTRDQSLVETTQKEMGHAEIIGAVNAEAAWCQSNEYGARLVVLDNDDDSDAFPWTVPVLQLSLADRYRRAQEIGAQAVFTKPLLREQLLTALNAFASQARRILVVDDDTRFADLVTRMLSAEGKGREVYVAYDAAQALTVASEEQIDAFILDQMLPDMNGTELLPRLRALPRYRSTPMFFVTAHNLELLVGARCSEMRLLLPEGSTSPNMGHLLGALSEVLAEISLPRKAASVRQEG